MWVLALSRDTCQRLKIAETTGSGSPPLDAKLPLA